ncbi:MAG: IreB family regulatory phosphoprotein [Syntrophomonadaceae bacterium]|nr:IreB family regulatory phosphoprotein [Syntrophomonadaceae bacterium]MDD3889674.1 IreB family regulatory phosphoprotein [Syntrophomonadaceae bacterium]MDD4550094.1 IreB family regulatory phosphoprotein [Syntrophomonadaceae bacterium]
MPQQHDETVSFKLQKDSEEKVRSILEAVYAALETKGYNPINQLVGYMISGEPAYITSHNDARKLICKIDRDEILEVLLKNYL